MSRRKSLYENQNQVQSLILGGNYRQAENMIQNVLRQQPAHFEALLDFGHALIQQERFEEGLVFFRRALMTKEYCPRPELLSYLWYQISTTLMSLNRPLEALDCIERAEAMLLTYDYGVDEPEEYARVRADILRRMEEEDEEEHRLSCPAQEGEGL